MTFGLPLLLAGLVGPLVALRATFPGWEIPFLIAAAVALITAIVLQVRRAMAESRRTASVEQAGEHLRKSLRDTLVPLAGHIAEIPALMPSQRLTHMRLPAKAATVALFALVSERSPGVRATVYDLDVELQQMTWMAYTGRGEKPGNFTAGTKKGDAALSFVRGGRPVIYENLDSESPEWYDPERTSYKTFASCPIWTNQGAYGMVTIDAPEANSLTEGDKYLVEVVAEIMSMAFESVRNRPNARPSNNAKKGVK